MDEIQRFRQAGSRCAGHPERGLLPGIELTTGPLGQGVANAIGLAIAERLLAARFNVDGVDVVDHRVIAECGEGDLMEGVSAEASSLAGHLGLGKLTLLYDDNQVTLDGPARWAFTEDVATRYLGYGWHVVRLEEVDDLAAVDLAMKEAEAETERPTIVIMHSHIGIGTPIHDDHRAHGAPVGPAYAAIARELLHWPHPPFEIPEEVYRTWRSQVAERARARRDWLDRFAGYRSAYPDLAAELERMMSGRLPDGWDADLPRFVVGGDELSTRVAGYSRSIPRPVRGCPPTRRGQSYAGDRGWLARKAVSSARWFGVRWGLGKATACRWLMTKIQNSSPSITRWIIPHVACIVWVAVL